MSETEKAKRIETLLPSLSAIREEYRAQGRELTEAEAEAIRQQIREGLASGHLDAMETILGDDALDRAVGGLGAPTPTIPIAPTPTPTTTVTVSYRPN